MDLLSSVKLALGGIMANKLRSFLTVLGVTIGVAVVIGLVAIGQGTQNQIRAQIECLGTTFPALFYLASLPVRLHDGQVAVSDATSTVGQPEFDSL
ncbi:MAG: ABC transporter permease [Bacillota bacterium]